jgi:MFS family permease
MVVTMQFWVSRRVEKIPPLIGMMIGATFSTMGYAMFGFIEGILMFAVSMAILTIGEMVLDPMSQTLAAKFSPPDMRGRYMAAHRFSMTLSNLITPYLAGLVIDTYNPNWIWTTCGIVGTIAIFGYLFLHFRLKRRKQLKPADI